MRIVLIYPSLILGKFLWKIFRLICITILRDILEELGRDLGESGRNLGGKALNDVLHKIRLFYITQTLLH